MFRRPPPGSVVYVKKTGSDVIGSLKFNKQCLKEKKVKYKCLVRGIHY